MPTADDGGLLARILETPRLAEEVRRLPPEILHRVIEQCGLEACGELVALATPEQLTRVFDLDLWRAARPGQDEQLDAARFGVWLDVLAEAGAGVAAATLAAMDPGLAIAALAAHVLVFDQAAGCAPLDGFRCEVGGYLVAARRTDAWHAIVPVLAALDADHRDRFHQVMRGCRTLSNSAPEVDGLHDLLAASEQALFDLALARERRREELGYVTPAQARAFLQSARRPGPAGGADALASPITRAYFRSIARAPAADAAAPGAGATADVLGEAGVLATPPRALLEGSQARVRLARLQAALRVAHDAAPVSFAARSQELAYLANTLAAGCSVQGRPFTAQEASDAAASTCNLGLENWTEATPDDFLVEHDLVGVFQVGWHILHRDVGQYAAGRLIDVLAGLRHADEAIQTGLDLLRLELIRHERAGTPWRARTALDVITLLDPPAWAALAGLLDECAVLHAAVGATLDARARAISSTAFAFISENRQIATVRAFMQALPALLSG